MVSLSLSLSLSLPPPSLLACFKSLPVSDHGCLSVALAMIDLCAGVGGNLVAVQASRISTFLHSAGNPQEKPPSPEYEWRGILQTFWGSEFPRVLVMC